MVFPDFPGYPFRDKHLWEITEPHVYGTPGTRNVLFQAINRKTGAMDKEDSLIWTPQVKSPLIPRDSLALELRSVLDCVSRKIKAYHQAFPNFTDVSLSTWLSGWVNNYYQAKRQEWLEKSFMLDVNLALLLNDSYLKPQLEQRARNTGAEYVNAVAGHRGCIDHQQKTYEALQGCLSKFGKSDQYVVQKIGVRGGIEHHAIAIFRKGQRLSEALVVDPWVMQSSEVDRMVYPFEFWDFWMTPLKLQGQFYQERGAVPAGAFTY